MVIEKKRIRKIDDFDHLKSEWRKVEEGADMTVYQLFSWNRLLVQEHFNTFMSGFFSDIVVYIAKEEEKVVCILPLIVQKRSNKTKWFGRKKGIYILGHASYSDYLNAIYKKIDTDEMDMLFEILKRDYPNQRMILTDLIEGTLFEKYMEGAGAKKLESTVSVAVAKEESPDAYNKKLSKHVRQNLRTAVNRMNKDGIEYNYKIVNGPIDDKVLLNQFRDIHIERMREKNTIETDLIHKLSSRVRVKYRTHKEKRNNIIYESMRSMKNSFFVIVFINGVVSGYLYGLRDRNTIRIMQNCFRSEYKFYSPMFRGIYDFLIKNYEDDEIDKVDFTRGNESYKYQLAGVDTVLKQYCMRL